MFSWHMAAFIFLVIFYHPPDFHMKHRSDGKTKLQLLAELDYVGIFLFTAGGVLFLVGINFGGRQFAWASAEVIAPIICGILSYVLLGFWEVYANPKYPLLPPKLFKKIRAFVMVIVVCFVGGMLYYSMNVLWPRQSQLFFVSADEPVMRGVYSMIFSCGTFRKLFRQCLVLTRLTRCSGWYHHGVYLLSAAPREVAVGLLHDCSDGVDRIVGFGRGQ